MRLSRFYVETPLSLGDHELPETVAHHLCRVLRRGPGDALQLFDGSGQDYTGVISEISKKRVRVTLDQVHPGLAESPLKIHLGQGLSRGERMDWAIQKATELGVSEITPLICERGEVRLNDDRWQKRSQHWRQIIVSACEQCGRSTLPKLHDPISLNVWIGESLAELKLVLHPDAPPMQKYTPPDSVAFLIGPEGGLSPAEVNQAMNHDFRPTSLGPRILRTETAPVAALAIAQALWGDLNPTPDR